MKRFPVFFILLVTGVFILGANGCSSDPNVEGAKLDLRNKDYDRALQNLETALEKNPNNADALELKGQVLQEQASGVKDPEQHAQLIDQMIQAYRRAVEVDPGRAENITARLRLAYFNEFQQGIQAFNRGQNNREAYSDAALYFDLAGQIQPDSADAFVNKAYALLNAGRQAEAIEPFEIARQKGEQSPEAVVLLSDLYLAEGRAPEAITVLEQAKETHQNNQEIQARLLNAYIAANQIDQAMTSYRAAVEEDPENKLYRYNFGSLLLQSEDYEGAIVQLQKAVQIDPDYGNAQYNLGAAFVNRAVDVSDRINELDDKLRAERSTLSAAEIRQMEAEMEDLAEQRRAFFAQAVPPLERAKELLEADEADVSSVCQALFSAYVQTDQQQKAEAIAECAGYEDLN